MSRPSEPGRRAAMGFRTGRTLLTGGGGSVTTAPGVVPARRSLTAALGLALLGLGLPLHASAQLPNQTSVGLGAEFVGYGFDAGLGADAAELLMIPVAVRFPASGSVTFDVFGAWARGRVERENTSLELSGPTDTQIRMSFQATPWALVTVGAQLPTGDAAHTPEEAVVASVLSTDLLGFRESNWGSGAGLTTSVATATRAGDWGVGLAAAYALRGSFSPDANAESIRYEPGDETRIRIGFDRNIGTHTLTLGGSFITYAEDQSDGRNLFRSGNRFRLDASYAFRAGAGVWTLYAADVVRSNGDLTLQIVDDFGSQLGDTTVTTAKQNLLVTGFVGAIDLGSGFVFRPHVDFKLQARSEPSGSDAGSGWMLAAGGDVPVRVFGRSEFFPKARVLVGSIRNQAGESTGVLGMELRGTLRWSP
ncbi:MAG: hypothetical protein WD995_01210 [Gemmatimonadota bacterium]